MIKRSLGASQSLKNSGWLWRQFSCSWTFTVSAANQEEPPATLLQESRSLENQLIEKRWTLCFGKVLESANRKKSIGERDTLAKNCAIFPVWCKKSKSNKGKLNRKLGFRVRNTLVLPTYSLKHKKYREGLPTWPWVLVMLCYQNRANTVFP